MVWTHGRDELNKFINYLNSIHPKIKFTSEINDTYVNFLDTTVKIDADRSIYTTLYEKPTDTHLYLHYQSAHHKPCHQKGPFGQFLRIRRICTKNKDFIDNGVKMIEHYMKRGYPLGIFHNRNPSNLDSSDQRIRLFCDLNLNLDYESVDLPLEVDQRIQSPWITHNSL